MRQFGYPQRDERHCVLSELPMRQFGLVHLILCIGRFSELPMRQFGSWGGSEPLAWLSELPMRQFG